MKLDLIFLAVLGMAATTSATDDHPIKKIIGMIEELKVEAQKQAEEEGYAYQKFEYWCKTTSKELNKAIAEGKDHISVLEDTIESKKKDIAKFKVDIEELDKQIEENEAASAKAKKIREE